MMAMDTLFRDTNLSVKGFYVKLPYIQALCVKNPHFCTYISGIALNCLSTTILWGALFSIHYQ